MTHERGLNAHDVFRYPSSPGTFLSVLAVFDVLAQHAEGEFV